MTDNEHQLMDAYKKAGGLPENFQHKDLAYLMVHNNQVLKSQTISGLEITCHETKTGVDIKFIMRKGYKFEKPVYLCFGIIPKEGIQEINVTGTIEDNSKLEFLAHCVFPQALKIRHEMQGNILIGENAYFKYTEVHYHGENGGINVIPNLQVTLGKNSTYLGSFYLTKGRTGTIDIDYTITASENSKSELLAKVSSNSDDNVRIKEKIILLGNNSKGLIQTRAICAGNSTTDVISELTAIGAKSVGHVDCIETVFDNAIAKATPLVDVRHKDAKVTHEAAIGSVNKKQLETIMAKGYNEDEATEIIVRSLLK